MTGFRVQAPAAFGAVGQAKNIHVGELALEAEGHGSVRDLDQSTIVDTLAYGAESQTKGVSCSQNRRGGLRLLGLLGIGDAHPELRDYLVGPRSTTVLEHQGEFDGVEKMDWRSSPSWYVAFDPHNNHVCAFREVKRLAGQLRGLCREKIRLLHLGFVRSVCALRLFNRCACEDIRFDSGFYSLLSRIRTAPCRAGRNPHRSEASASDSGLPFYRIQALQGHSGGDNGEDRQYPVGQISGAECLAKVLPPWALRLIVSLTCLAFGLRLAWRSGVDRRLCRFWWVVLTYGLLVVGAFFLFPAAR